MYDVLCLGSATIDVFIDYAKRTREIKLGEKVLISNLEKHTGGGANNSATALKKMGLRVKALIKVGDDHDGELIVKELRRAGVNCILRIDKEQRTSFSTIMSSVKEADRTIYTYKGASDNLGWNEVDKKALKNARFIYLATLLKKSFKTCLKICEYAKRNKINVLFNPSSYLAAQGKGYLKKILDATTILVLNKEEAKKLLGVKSGNVKEILKKLIDLGPRVAVVTEGKKGVHAFDGEKYYFVKPYPVKVVHTAGAGDAFTSAFLAVYLKEGNIEKALKFGNANAASVIQHYGTKHILLSYNGALRFVKKHKAKVFIQQVRK